MIIYTIMNDFSIRDVAIDYTNKHFYRSSLREKERVINDWTNKIKNSKSLVEDFKKRIGDPAGKKILDAGSGNGGTSIAFALAGAEVFGVEIEKDLYEISKKYAKSEHININFYLYDGLRLPFENNYFDYAVSASVLEHTDNPVLYLSEILRILKPSGALYLGFPNKMAIRETHTQLLFLTYLPNFLRPLYIKLFNRSPIENYYLHFYNYFDLKKIIKKVNDENKPNNCLWNLIEEKGESQSFLKKIIKKILNLFGIHYKFFLPHILVVLKKQPK